MRHKAGEAQQRAQRASARDVRVAVEERAMGRGTAVHRSLEAPHGRGMEPCAWRGRGVHASPGRQGD